MGLFRKKADPISDRARALNDEIALLEAQIKKLDTHLAQQKTSPPEPPAPTRKAETQPATPKPEPTARPARKNADAPVFEDVDSRRLQPHGAEPATTPDHFNELGVRKYDLPALLRRWRSHFRGPSTTNPKLVSYLAAGGIQGLRPLRYERRVARNRFIALVALLFMILLGLLAAFVRRH